MFGMAAITLGIGPHSSWFCCDPKSSSELQPVVGNFNYRKMTVMTAGVVDVAACY